MHLLAWGSDEHRPAWLRATAGEKRYLIELSMLVLIGLQFAIPAGFALPPRFLAPAVEVALLLAIIAMHRGTSARRTPTIRIAAQVLLGLVTATNTIALGLLVHDIVTGAHIAASKLLLGGAEIWLTNLGVFGIWLWEYDRGGPTHRAHGRDVQPDLLFPQMTDEHLAQDWEPTVIDYLYVSYTNAVAFSPTDTMPLTRWAKGLFALESFISVVTVLLVAARAVNVFPAG